MTATLTQTIRNGVKGAVPFEFRGLALSHQRKHHDRIIRAIKSFSGFIKNTANGSLEVKWQLYWRMENESRDLLTLVLQAAGVLTEEPEPGDVRIVGDGSPESLKLTWGPVYHGEELIFSAAHADQANAYVSAWKKRYESQRHEDLDARTEIVQ